ncbi:DUF4142 domain-containing protein [Roseomonas sp. NAR14]|uniref:DUF4142 domain-containing protein n=1 Tax=Roseomonas acroporae TaxID=2937791 RepID=A0A9X2BUD2_9PROT|nr:DUF4142 domain-containing protein [Roseomonas acroporae]MCK8785503.1 DUF4142 domain-containing protein [Roseomonas acroporae]
MRKTLALTASLVLAVPVLAPVLAPAPAQAQVQQGIPDRPVQLVPPRPSQRVFTNPFTGQVSANTFVANASQIDQFEINAARLALDRSRHPQIRALAEVTLRDHLGTSAQLRAMPDAATRLRPGMDEEQTALMERLQRAQGIDFDALYLQAQVDGHERALSLFRSYSESGDIAVLRAFAASTVPKLEEHLAMARALQAPTPPRAG